MLGSRFTISALVAASFALVASQANAQNYLGRPPVLEKVGITQNLNKPMPLDATFVDETGKTVRLSEFFHGRPVIFAFVYYTCPMLCNLELDGLMSTIKKIPLKPGKDFEVVAISFDPRDTPAIALAKRATYAKELGSTAGLHFLTGTDQQIHRATDAAGFQYVWDPTQKQYAHASGIMVATPAGVLSKYFYGIHYNERDLRLGLVEASDEKIGTPADEILLFCYCYNPETGKYGLAIANSLRIGGGLFLVAMVAGIFMLTRRGGPGQPSAPGAESGHPRVV
jgi:protein SCO1/2